MSEPRWYGSGNKTPENTDLCVEAVYRHGGWHMGQCCRKRGHGPDDLYCKQHANRIQKRKDDQVRYEKEHEMWREEWALEKFHGKLLKGDAVFMHALREMAVEVYNLIYGGKKDIPDSDRWIEEEVQDYLDAARLVRVKPSG